MTVKSYWYRDSFGNTYCASCGERIPYIFTWGLDEDEKYNLDDYFEKEIHPTPYCPLCGAFMETISGVKPEPEGAYEYKGDAKENDCTDKKTESE